jgi:hypothetical protein
METDTVIKMMFFQNVTAHTQVGTKVSEEPATHSTNWGSGFLRNAGTHSSTRLPTVSSQQMVILKFTAVVTSYLRHSNIHAGGPDSSVSILPGYRLDSPGIESRWGRYFLHLSRPALGPTQPPLQWVPGQSSRGVTLPPCPLLVPLVMKE